MPFVGQLPLDAKRGVVLTSSPELWNTFEDLSVHVLHVWNAAKTDWEEFTMDECIPVRECDTLLARVPDVEKLTYFGVEALAHHFRSKDQAGLKVRTNGPAIAQQPEASSSTPNNTNLERATAGINWVY